MSTDNDKLDATSANDLREAILQTSVAEGDDSRMGNVWEDIKERITSPFIFSFITGWLIANWRIPIALVKYDSTSIKKIGYDNFLSFITNHWNAWTSVTLPLGTALTYCFLWPVIRDEIKLFQAKQKVRTNKRLNELGEDFLVPMSLYLRLKGQFNNIQTANRKLIVDELKVVEENGTLKKIIDQKDEDRKAEVELKAKVSNKEIEKLNGLLDDARKTISRLNAAGFLQSITGIWKVQGSEYEHTWDIRETVLISKYDGEQEIFSLNGTYVANENDMVILYHRKSKPGETEDNGFIQLTFSQDRKIANARDNFGAHFSMQKMNS